MRGQNLVVYYTWSGNTRRIAEKIHEIVGGDIIEIEPQIPYPDSYNEVVEQARIEIRDDYKPPLKTKIDNTERYETIFIGSPNWWGTIAPPVRSFLLSNDFSGKRIAPYISHGGGGKQRTVETIKKLCPDSDILRELIIHNDGGEVLRERVLRWLEDVMETY